MFQCCSVGEANRVSPEQSLDRRRLLMIRFLRHGLNRQDVSERLRIGAPGRRITIRSPRQNEEFGMRWTAPRIKNSRDPSIRGSLSSI